MRFLFLRSLFAALTVVLVVVSPVSAAVTSGPRDGKKPADFATSGVYHGTYIGANYKQPLPTSSRAAVLVNSTCQDVLFLGARGSGQSGDESVSFGMGPEVASVLTRVTTTRTVGYAAVIYPAQAVEDLVDPGQYFAGLADGESWTTSFLSTRAARCPVERIVLSGYSQGAMVMHRVAHDLITSAPNVAARIDGLVLMGDGDRLWNDESSDHPSLADTDNGAGFFYPAVSGSSSTLFPVNWISRVHEICDDTDPVCHFSALRLAAGLDGHMHYAASPFVSDAVDAVNRQVQHTGKLLPLPKVLTSVLMSMRWAVPFYGESDPGVPADEVELAVAPGSALPSGLNIQPGGVIAGQPTSSLVASTKMLVRLRIGGGPAVSAWQKLTAKWLWLKKVQIGGGGKCARTFCTQTYHGPGGSLVRIGQYGSWSAWEVVPGAYYSNCSADDCFIIAIGSAGNPQTRILDVHVGYWADETFSMMPWSLNSLSCAGNGACGAAGFTFGGTPLLYTRQDGLWTVHYPYGFTGTQFPSAACAGDGSCLLQSPSRSPGYTDFFQYGPAGARAATAEVPPGTVDQRTTCGSVSTCFVPVNTASGAFISQWLGASWSVPQLVTADPGVLVQGLACAGATCWASLSDGRAAAWDAVTTGWTVTVINPSLTSAPSIQCWAADDCQTRPLGDAFGHGYTWSPSTGWV